MTYDIKEPWRPICEDDGQDLRGLQEGYIEKLVDGRSLIYMREDQREDFTGCLLTYFAHQRDEENKPSLIAQMVDGKIAMHNSGEVQHDHLHTANLPGYLSVIAKNLDGLLTHFSKVPASNDFYKTEIATLKTIEGLTKKLKEGRLSDSDKDNIFWM